MLAFRRAISLLGVAILLMSPNGCRKRQTHVAAPEPSITLVAVGDVMLDRGIGKRITEYGIEWPFKQVRDTLRTADLAFCNLECPLTSRGIKVRKPICFKADPANVECLTDAGFDIVSLANNHSMDCGRTGLLETMHYLDKTGIAYTGAGGTPSEAAEPIIVTVKGIRIAFLARNAWLPEGAWFRQDAPNSAYLDSETIESEVRDAAGRADVVVVSLHWGIEYRMHPQPAQVELARKIIDAGADLILGHHPHVLQPVEKYHGGVIAYSLANFLFDSPFRNCKQTMILKCRLTKSGVVDIAQMPIRIDDCRPGVHSSSVTGDIRSDRLSIRFPEKPTRD